MKRLLPVMFVLLFPLTVLAAEAPTKDAASATKNLLKPTNDVESWVFEVNGDGQGEMNVVEDVITFTTTKTDGTDWHVQTYQPNLDLEEGKTYVVKFQAKSPSEVTAVLVGQIHQENWHEIGLHQEVSPGKEFDDFEYEFTATDVVDGNNRIGFVLGLNEGDLSVKNMTLMEKQ